MWHSFLLQSHFLSLQFSDDQCLVWETEDTLFFVSSLFVWLVVGVAANELLYLSVLSAGRKKGFWPSATGKFYHHFNWKVLILSDISTEKKDKLHVLANNEKGSVVY